MLEHLAAGNIKKMFCKRVLKLVMLVFFLKNLGHKMFFLKVDFRNWQKFRLYYVLVIKLKWNLYKMCGVLILLTFNAEYLFRLVYYYRILLFFFFWLMIFPFTSATSLVSYGKTSIRCLERPFLYVMDVFKTSSVRFECTFIKMFFVRCGCFKYVFCMLSIENVLMALLCLKGYLCTLWMSLRRKHRNNKHRVSK